MPNHYLSVLYKHKIQVENKNVGLKVCVWGGGGTNIPLPPNQKSVGGGHMPPCPLPPLPTPVIYECTNTNLYAFVGLAQSHLFNDAFNIFYL